MKVRLGIDIEMNQGSKEEREKALNELKKDMCLLIKNRCTDFAIWEEPRE